MNFQRDIQVGDNLPYLPTPQGNQGTGTSQASLLTSYTTEVGRKCFAWEPLEDGGMGPPLEQWTKNRKVGCLIYGMTFPTQLYGDYHKPWNKTMK